jgi:hypothetical protein
VEKQNGPIASAIGPFFLYLSIISERTKLYAKVLGNYLLIIKGLESILRAGT